MAAAIRLSQQHSCSFDHLICDRHHSRRNRQAERLGSLEVDHELELGRLYHRQICDLCAVENTPDIDAHLKHVLGAHGRVAHQTAGSDEFTPLVHCRNRVASGERDELLAPDLKERVGAHEQGASPALDEGCKCEVDFIFGASIEDHDCLPIERAVSRICVICTSAIWLLGFTKKAIVRALGTNSRSSCRRLGPSEAVKACTPVALPSGRSKRLTRPSVTGSLPLVKTSGIVDVAAKTARAGWLPPVVTITTAWRSTSSFANAGKRS